MQTGVGLTAVKNIDSICIGKPCLTRVNADTVTAVKLGTQLHLLADNLLSTFQHPWKGKPARLTDFPEHWVGIELNNLFYSVTQGLGWDSTQVSTVPAYHVLIFYDGDLLTFLGCIHCCTFARWASADNNHVVAIICHALFLRLINQ